MPSAFVNWSKRVEEKSEEDFALIKRKEAVKKVLNMVPEDGNFALHFYQGTFSDGNQNYIQVYLHPLDSAKDL